MFNVPERVGLRDNKKGKPVPLIMLVLTHFQTQTRNSGSQWLLLFTSFLNMSSTFKIIRFIEF